MRRTISFLMAVILACAAWPALGTEDGGARPVLRALLVTCDRFVSRPETTPAAQQNALMVKGLLEADARGFSVIRTECDTLSSVEAFSQAVTETFSEAAEQDISLIYISTHGLYSANRSNLSASLLLSDGTREERLTAQALAGILYDIPGTKLLVLDACHSGAFIGKGLSDFAQANPFATEGFHVLCSAGGSEESWYWRADGGDALHGAGYFTSVLSSALGSGGSAPADRDLDGRVTMTELRQFLLDHYAASTPQIYPENSDCVFFETPKNGEAEPDILTDIRFDQTVFSGNVMEIGFSFRLNRPAAVDYQLVYDQRNAWDFADAPMMTDGGDGAVLPEGVHEMEITLTLGDEEQDVSGYLMLQIYVREGDRMFLHESRLLRVFPSQGDMALDVRTASAFFPAQGEELEVRVYHDIPCALTVSVQNAQGKTIRYLAIEQATRPQRLVPEGTTLYWDGKLQDGSAAPKGKYLICVRTGVGRRTYTVYSEYFNLEEPQVSGSVPVVKY